MAIQVDYELDDVIHRDTYIRIHKVNTVAVDNEFFETVNDPDHPEIHQKLSWKVTLQTEATAYVWGDQKARENRAQQLHWFKFKFDYDLNNPDNIYRQAYNALKSADAFKDAVDV